MDSDYDIEEVEVQVTETLTKATTIGTHEPTLIVEGDFDATLGRMSNTRSYEYSDLKDDFLQQERTACQCLKDCVRVLKELVKEKRTYFAHTYIPQLLNDCTYWEQESIEVTEM